VEAALADTQDPLNGQVARFLYGQPGRFEDTHAVYERLIHLDPGNLFLLEDYITNLEDLRRPQEALEALAAIAAPRLPVFELFRKKSRACISYDFTGKGDLAACLALSDSAIEATYGAGPGTLLQRARNLVRLHRYADARSVLEKSSATQSFGEPETGPQPLAEELGWIALLMDDARAARRQGEAIRAYSARTPKNNVQAWYGKALAAEAQLFQGDRAGAIAAIEEVLDARPREKDAWSWYFVARYSARIFAWAGAEDRAVSLIDNLSTVQGGIPPALITHDPYFDMPLARNARWQALKARLEAHMAATKLE
jgi:tetratricopeptide (TPR) repeat protein